jgi:hypothetical protein
MADPRDGQGDAEIFAANEPGQPRPDPDHAVIPECDQGVSRDPN